MATFKLSKKDALSNTRTNINDLHEKKLEYFESEKNKLDEYILLLEKYKSTNDNLYNTRNKITELETKIENIENDKELNEYLLDFFGVINKKETEYENNIFKGQMDTFIQSKINYSRTELYNEYIKKFGLHK